MNHDPTVAAMLGSLPPLTPNPAMSLSPSKFSSPEETASAITAADANLRQHIHQMYYRLRGITEGWKFQFATQQPDVEYLNKLLLAPSKHEYYFSCGQLLKYMEEEMVKLTMVFKLFDEKSQEDASKLHQLQVDLHQLRNYKTDYEANHEGFLKRMGNKLSGEEKLSAVERASLQRSILESNRLAKEVNAERAKMQLELAAMDQLNKRLQKKLNVAQKRIREAGLQSVGDDSEIYIPPLEDSDAAHPSDTPANKFAPLGHALNPGVKPTPSSSHAPSSSSSSSASTTPQSSFPPSTPLPPSSSIPPSTPLNMDPDIMAALDALSPAAPTFKPLATELERLKGLSQEWTAAYGLVVTPLPADFYAAVATIATTAREALGQAQAMTGAPSARDYRQFGRTVNYLLMCSISVAGAVAELAKQCAPCANLLHDFLLMITNPTITLTEIPPECDFRPLLVSYLKYLQQLKSTTPNFIINNS